MDPQELSSEIPDSFLDNLEEGLEIEQSLREQDRNKQAFFLQTLLETDSPSPSMPSDRSTPLDTTPAVSTGPTSSPQAAVSDSFYSADLTHQELQARLARLYGRPLTNTDESLRRGLSSSYTTSFTNEPIELVDRNNSFYSPDLSNNHPFPTHQTFQMRSPVRQGAQSTTLSIDAQHYGSSYGSSGPANSFVGPPQHSSALHNTVHGYPTQHALSNPFQGGMYAGQYHPPQQTGATYGGHDYFPPQAQLPPSTDQNTTADNALDAGAVPTKKRSKPKTTRNTQAGNSGSTGKGKKLSKARNEGRLFHGTSIKPEYKNMTPDEIFSTAESGEICGGALLHIAKSLNNWQIANKLNALLDSKNKPRTSANNITKRITAALKKRDADAPTRKEINDSRKAKGIYKKQQPKQTKTKITNELHVEQLEQPVAGDPVQTQESEFRTRQNTLLVPTERTLKRTASEAQLNTPTESTTSARPIRRTRPRMQGAATMSRSSKSTETTEESEGSAGDTQMHQEDTFNEEEMQE